MKKLILKLFTLAFGIGLAGCVSLGPEQSKKPITDLNAQIKPGMTKEQVTTVAGDAQSASSQSNGAEAWEYWQNSKKGGGMSKLVAINSFGMFKNVPSEFRDILDVTFTNGIVAAKFYRENVDMAAQLQNH